MVDKKISELPTRSPLDPADFLPLSGLNQSGQFATYKVSIGALANQIARTRIDNGAVTPSVIGLVDGQDVDQTAELFRSRPSTEMTGFVHTAGAIFIVPQAEWDNSWLASEIPPQYGANLGTEMSFTVTDLMGGSLLAGEYTLAIQDIFADPADKEVVSLARAYGNLNFIEAVAPLPPEIEDTTNWTITDTTYTYNLAYYNITYSSADKVTLFSRYIVNTLQWEFEFFIGYIDTENKAIVVNYWVDFGIEMTAKLIDGSTPIVNVLANPFTLKTGLVFWHDLTTSTNKITRLNADGTATMIYSQPASLVGGTRWNMGLNSPSAVGVDGYFKDATTFIATLGIGSPSNTTDPRLAVWQLNIATGDFVQLYDSALAYVNNEDPLKTTLIGQNIFCNLHEFFAKMRLGNLISDSSRQANIAWGGYLGDFARVTKNSSAYIDKIAVLFSDYYANPTQASYIKAVRLDENGDYISDAFFEDFSAMALAGGGYCHAVSTEDSVFAFMLESASGESVPEKERVYRYNYLTNTLTTLAPPVNQIGISQWRLAMATNGGVLYVCSMAGATMKIMQVAI